MFLRERGLVAATMELDQSHAVTIDWLSEAVSRAIVPAVGWVRWPVGNDVSSTRRSVSTRMRRYIKSHGRPFIHIYAPAQFTCIELGADEPSVHVSDSST